MNRVLQIYYKSCSFMRLQTHCVSSQLFTLRHITKNSSLRTEQQPKPDATSTGLLLSDSCVQQIKKVAEDGSFLRVLVDSGGCSGFQYKFELDNKMNEDDRIFEKAGARVVIDTESLKMIDGSTIDFKVELIRSAFCVISNPQAEHNCSCGASFSIKL